MDLDLYCLIDGGGRVYVKDGAAAHSEVATSFALDANACDAYRFDLAARRLLVDRGSTAGDRAAHAYWNLRVGSPARLMAFAAEGHLTKHALGSLLTAEHARAYFDTCAALERQYTTDCAAKGDPCLESGCALEGDVCLEPLLQAGGEYHQACAAAWRLQFEDKRHRAPVWMH